MPVAAAVSALAVGVVGSVWIAGALLITSASGRTNASGRTLRAHQADAQLCADRYAATREESNPLMLPVPPGPNPLSGARFFVPGPAHGVAAGAIEALLGINPSRYPDTYTWARFEQDLDSGPLSARLAADPGLRAKVQELEKIAAEPEEARFTPYSAGGGPGAVFSQVQKYFCFKLAADPGAIPIITTYFLHQGSGCLSIQQILEYRSRFERQVSEMAAGIGNRPAVLLLELDAIGSSRCLQLNGALPYWEGEIRYEIDEVSALPHTVVYIEGGYSDSNGPVYTANALNAVGVRKIRGFFTNDTHFQWTINEIRWGDAVSKLTGGAHFIVNTGENGRGPLLNPNPVTQGVEDLCNPPGRGLGPKPTTDTGFALVDAYLWTGVPGNSAGSCNGGPAPGSFWPARAISLAENAQGKLGPGYPADPY